jgi:hypothetical protein
LKKLFVPTVDSIGLESKLGQRPAPHAERAGHSSWRTSEGFFSRLLVATRSGALGANRDAALETEGRPKGRPIMDGT